MHLSPPRKSHSGQGRADGLLRVPSCRKAPSLGIVWWERDADLNQELSRNGSQLLPFPVHGRLSDLGLSPVNRVRFWNGGDPSWDHKLLLKVLGVTILWHEAWLSLSLSESYLAYQRQGKADSRGTTVQKVRLKKKKANFISYVWANGVCNALRYLYGAASVTRGSRARKLQPGEFLHPPELPAPTEGTLLAPGKQCAEGLPLSCPGSSTSREKWGWDPRDVWVHCCCTPAIGRSKTLPS